LEVLRRLPTDFEMEMKALAMAEEADKGPGQRRSFKGKVFESVVRADPNICPLGETPQAKILRSILDNPARFDLATEGINNRMRNPDVAHINQKKEIDWVVEAKMSPLNARGLAQIDEFKTTISTLIDKLKRIDPKKLISHGLSAILDNPLDNPSDFSVSKDFTIKLAFPSGIYDGSTKSLLLLRHPDQASLDTLNRCRIRESPFSVNDLENITDTILGWYKEKTV
jgi:hypothetical protein